MRRNKWKASLIIALIFLLVACKTSSSEQGERVLEELAKGNYDFIYENIFSETLQERLTAHEMGEQWEAIQEKHGDLQLTEVPTERENNENIILEYNYTSEVGTVDIRMIFDQESLLRSIHFEEDVLAKLPDGLVEENVIIGEGTEFELEGTLTLPDNMEEAVPVVTIVHGSGPNDRDGNIAAYTPYRDLAWGLADKGIAVLRYDKRTFVYPASAFPDDFTLYDETIEDAVRAAELLIQDNRFESIYVAGHSLGGMAAPRILAKSKDYAGMISLAGSLRSFTDIYYDQLVLFHELGLITDKMMEEFELEYKKSLQLDTLEDDELVFGIPVNYLQDMEQFDSEAFFTDANYPVLILQGEDDYQVIEEDYESWKFALEAYEYVDFKLYPGLNHFFVDYSGPGEGTPTEYQYEGSFSQEVIEDMAKWIYEQEEEGTN